MNGDTMSFRDKKDKVGLGTWWWGLSDIVQNSCDNKCENVLEFLEQNNVTEIYLAIGGLTLDGQEINPNHPIVKQVDLQQFVRNCKSRGMRVSGLIGVSGEATKNWLDPAQKAKEFNYYSEKIFEYNKRSKYDEKLYAVHLDVEPHTIKDFAQNRKKYIQQMADFVFYASKLCTQHGLSIEYDVFGGFEVDDCVYDNKGAFKNIIDIVTNLCSSICVMSYRNTAARQMAFGPSRYMPYAIKNKCRLIVGAETMQVQEGVPANITYSSVGKEIFLTEQQKLRKILESSDCENFGGAIHHVNTWYSFMKE